ncbi:MAG: chalcone isomerase family protein [Betaproteobacteria bacterium]|nr:chalcone isomerase family protein [Betaproteobacteria bacterium]
MKDKVVWCLALAAALVAGASSAVEIEGVKIADQAHLSRSGPPLILNGAGVRHKLAFLKVYVGALYLSAKKTSAEEVLADPGPKRVSMHVLIDELTARELTASLNNALAANHIPAELALIESRIQALNRMMNSLGAIKKGGVVLIDYLPDVGTRVTVNGEEKITIRGEDFFRALLRIWIGAKPVDGRLRDAMLGGSGGFRLF